MNRTDSSNFVARALPWFLFLHCGASFLHFIHNAEYLADYPNLPAWISRVSIYCAWLAIFSVGLCGYLLYRGRYVLPGLTLMSVYAILGLDGLLHYSRAPLAAHTAGMNATIWIEVATAAIVLIAVLRLAGHHLLRRSQRRAPRTVARPQFPVRPS